MVLASTSFSDVNKSCHCLAWEKKVQQAALEVGEAAEIRGRKPAKEDEASCVSGGEGIISFGPWK